MPRVLRASSAEVEELAARALGAGGILRLELSGGSMLPFVRKGDVVQFASSPPRSARLDDVVLFRAPSGKLMVHRVVAIRTTADGPRVIVRGDAETGPGLIVAKADILARAIRIERRGRPARAWRGGATRAWTRMHPIGGSLLALAIRIARRFWR